MLMQGSQALQGYDVYRFQAWHGAGRGVGYYAAIPRHHPALVFCSVSSFRHGLGCGAYCAEMPLLVSRCSQGCDVCLCAKSVGTMLPYM